MKRIFVTSFILLVFAANMAGAVTMPIVKPYTMTTRETKPADIFSKLPADKARLFQEKEVELKTKYAEINIKLKSATTAMNNILLVEPFNKEEYLKKVAAVQKLEAEKTGLRIAAITELAGKFKDVERKTLIDAFEEKTGKKYHSPIINR